MALRRGLLAAASLAAAGAWRRPALGQPAGFPNRPVVMVVPFTTGGSVDAVLRVFKPPLEQRLGQPIVPDYRPGGATSLGAAFVARARPDGHTLGMVVDSFAVNPSLRHDLPYDTLADLAPVTMIGTAPLVVVVGASSPIASLEALIDAARTRPGGLSYASVGVGSLNHLIAVQLGRTAPAPMHHVPYRGGGPAITDLIAGHVDVMISSVILARPHLDSGALRALAVTSTSRVAALPEVPTVAEAGLAGFQAAAWQGVVAPAGTPPEIVEHLHGAFREVLGRPEVGAALERLGILVSAASPGQFSAFLRAEIEHWGQVVREADIRVE